jgi:hypothetical protein
LEASIKETFTFPLATESVFTLSITGTAGVIYTATLPYVFTEPAIELESVFFATKYRVYILFDNEDITNE